MMSKAFGKKLWENLDDLAKEELEESGARIKYLDYTKEVVIEMYGDYRFKVPFNVFQEMLLFDKTFGKQKIFLGGDITNFYVEKVKVDYTQEFPKLQQIDSNFEEDLYEEVSLLQYKYRLEPGMLNEIVRQAHRRKLGRAKTAWVQLKSRVLKGGRKNYIQKDDVEERERIEYLKKNYDKILDNILKRDSYLDFYELEKGLHPGIREKEIVEKYKRLKNEYYAI